MSALILFVLALSPAAAAAQDGGIALSGPGQARVAPSAPIAVAAPTRTTTPARWGGRSTWVFEPTSRGAVAPRVDGMTVRRSDSLPHEVLGGE